MGTINIGFRDISETFKSKEINMNEAIPYFAGLITIIFGIGFYLILQENKD